MAGELCYIFGIVQIKVKFKFFIIFCQFFSFGILGLCLLKKYMMSLFCVLYIFRLVMMLFLVGFFIIQFFVMFFRLRCRLKLGFIILNYCFIGISFFIGLVWIWMQLGLLMKIIIGILFFVVVFSIFIIVLLGIFWVKFFGVRCRACVCCSLYFFSKGKKLCVFCSLCYFF